MVITELKEGKRNPSHIHVSVDGEYAFTTSIDLVARYHLKEGAALTGEQMQELLGEALLGQAKERALSLLSYRAYSRRELVKKLRSPPAPVPAAFSPAPAWNRPGRRPQRPPPTGWRSWATWTTRITPPGMPATCIT